MTCNRRCSTDVLRNAQCADCLLTATTTTGIGLLVKRHLGFRRPRLLAAGVGRNGGWCGGRWTCAASLLFGLAEEGTRIIVGSISGFNEVR